MDKGKEQKLDEFGLPIEETTETVGSEGEETPKSSEVDRKLEELTRLGNNLTTNQTLANLMADPDVRAVLSLKEAGKKVKIGEDGGTQESSQSSQKIVLDREKLDSMSPSELAQTILDAVGTNVGNIVDSKLKPLSERIEGVTGVLTDKESKSVAEEVKRVRSKYPDFDKYRQSMMEIFNQNQGLEVEELYLLAKRRGRTSEGENTPKGTRSEKPSGSTKPASPKEKEVKILPGQSGWRAAMSAALNKVPLPPELGGSGGE